ATNSISPLPDSLTSNRLRKIAVPNPATAPFGRSAMEYLKRQGLDSLLSEKLVFGESVSQTDQFVYSGAVRLGFTALGNAKAKMQPHMYHALTNHPLIEHGHVGLIQGEQPGQTRMFLKFLSSPSAKEILRKFGYFTAE
ncbi:MAG: molybdate ABC transporter substrate-binding protein, partial [Bacteroidota bacterium]